MVQEKIIAQKLLQINAVQLNVEHPFTWASGWKSPIYCDNRKILSFPYVREFVKSELCNEIFTRYSDAEIIAGVATGGIPWGAMVADQLKLPFIYVRSKPKGHGMGKQIEGFYEEGKRVAVVEDLISTGKSSLQAAQVLIDNGLKVDGMVAIFNYGFSVAKEAFAQKGIPFKTLSDYQSLISLAVDQGLVSAEDEKTLLNWRENPSEWGKLA